MRGKTEPCNSAAFWRAAARRAAARRAAAGVGCLALAMTAAACTGHAARPRGHVSSLGCYIGSVWLQASPSSAQAGTLVAITAEGHWRARRARDVGTQTWGLLGTAAEGRFVATYNLAAIVPGIYHQQNVPAGSAAALDSLGLPNIGFRVQVPPVPSGNYLIKFTYSVTPEAVGTAPRLYDLCTALHVSG